MLLLISTGLLVAGLPLDLRDLGGQFQGRGQGIEGRINAVVAIIEIGLEHHLAITDVAGQIHQVNRQWLLENNSHRFSAGQNLIHFFGSGWVARIIGLV